MPEITKTGNFVAKSVNKAVGNTYLARDRTSGGYPYNTCYLFDAFMGSKREVKEYLEFCMRDTNKTYLQDITYEVVELCFVKGE